MIRAILVDDERPALRGLELLLKEYPLIQVAGMFTNPLEALDAIARVKPQVVFLDINLPQLKGIDAASRILDLSPDTDIVFVTAYDQYALEAFEIHALDYLLKPVLKERVDITIARLLKKNKLEVKRTDSILEIKCFGGLHLGWQGQEPIKWRSEKTKELFAYLLLNEGRNISKEELIDKLWPEEDPDKAIRQLYNGIYYIRKAFVEYGINSSLLNIDSKYNLKIGPVQSDIKSFYELEKGGFPNSIEYLEGLARLYAGDYLENEYYPWAEIERERLLKLYLKCLTKLSQKLIEAKQWDIAEKYLKKAYDKNPYEEEITELLLKLYIETGNNSKVIRHFKAYTLLIGDELGVKPSKKLQGLVQSIK